jgi:anti-sigma B factor antagonist
VKTKKSVAEGVVTLVVSGKLSAATAEAFNQVVDAAFPDAIKGFVLDFKDVSYLASAGLRVLVATQKKLATKHLGIRFINVSDDVKEVFEVTGLDDIFDFG